MRPPRSVSPPIRTQIVAGHSRPPGKHVRAAIVYTWDHKNSDSFWAGMKVCVIPSELRNNKGGLDVNYRQPILADEVQTFKALITIHKVLQEGHPIVLKQAQAHIGFLESLQRGVAGGEGIRGMLPAPRPGPPVLTSSALQDTPR